MFKALHELRKNTRENGIREAIRIMFKKYGWKLGVAIFMYYLISCLLYTSDAADE